MRVALHLRSQSIEWLLTDEIVGSDTPRGTEPMLEVLATGRPPRHACSPEAGSWGSGLGRGQVGTLLLGGMPRTDQSGGAQADGTVASRGTSPGLRVVRQPTPADDSVVDVTALRPTGR